jgi:aldose 1-epimerase
MSPITLQTNHLRAVIMPEAGASIASFDAVQNGTWQPLMRPSPEHAIATRDVSLLASFNLLPWSNRIVGAAFNFQGQHYALRANTPQGFAIHGDARERAWQVTSQSAGTLTCTLNSSDFADFNFPFPFSAQITYRLADHTFDTTLSIANTGAQAMPAGFGFHPYFNRGFGASERDEVKLQFTAGGVCPPLPGMAAQPIPRSSGTQQQPDGTFTPIPDAMSFATLTSIGARDIDHCFGGWNGRATIAYPSAGVNLGFECDPVLGHIILYTPPGKPFFALEPVTHANDGFNLLAAGVPNHGIHVLQPGEQLSGKFRINVSFAA